MANKSGKVDFSEERKGRWSRPWPTHLVRVLCLLFLVLSLLLFALLHRIDRRVVGNRDVAGPILAAHDWQIGIEGADREQLWHDIAQQQGQGLRAPRGTENQRDGAPLLQSPLPRRRHDQPRPPPIPSAMLLRCFVASAAVVLISLRAFEARSQAGSRVRPTECATSNRGTGLHVKNRNRSHEE